MQIKEKNYKFPAVAKFLNSIYFQRILFRLFSRSCVAFSGKNRILGVAAKNQMVTNMKNTIYGFKRLLGRKYNDPQAQRELRSLTFKTSPQPDGSIGIHVRVRCLFIYFDDGIENEFWENLSPYLIERE